MPNDTFTAGDVLQNQISMEVNRARDYIAETVDTFQNSGILLNAAMQTSATDYDTIMKAEASKPLFNEIFFGVILTILPSLKLFERAAKVVGVVFPTGDNPVGKAAKAIKLIDDHYIGLTANFKEPISARQQQAESLSTVQTQFASRNVTATQVYGEFFDLLQKVSDLAVSSRRFIRMKEAEFYAQQDKNINLLAKIRKDFADAGVDGNQRVGKEELVKLSDNLLYDMLRNYVQNHVTISIEDNIGNHGRSTIMYGGKPVHFRHPAPGNVTFGAMDDKAIRTNRLVDLPEHRSDSLISGLSESQRDAIYGRYAQHMRHFLGDPRPPVYDYKGLIKHWGAKTVGKSGRNFRFV